MKESELADLGRESKATLPGPAYQPAPPAPPPASTAVVPFLVRRTDFARRRFVPAKALARAVGALRREPAVALLAAAAAAGWALLRRRHGRAGEGTSAAAAAAGAEAVVEEASAEEASASDAPSTSPGPGTPSSEPSGGGLSSSPSESGSPWKPKILLFSSSVSGSPIQDSHGRRMRTILEGKGVPYEEVDVSTSPRARGYMQSVSGTPQLPQLHAQGRLVGVSPARASELLLQVLLLCSVFLQFNGAGEGPAGEPGPSPDFLHWLRSF